MTDTAALDALAKALHDDHQASRNHGNCTWSDDHRWYAEQLLPRLAALRSLVPTEPDLQENPCCYSLHEFEAVCPRTGRRFVPTEPDAPEGLGYWQRKADTGEVRLPPRATALLGVLSQYDDHFGLLIAVMDEAARLTPATPDEPEVGP